LPSLRPLHGEGTDRNNRDRGETGQRLDLPRRVVAIEHGELESMSTISGRSEAALATLSAPFTASITV